ncbi:histone deacetylase 4 isoform X6 [Anticarsia gemmatalis]|uniref:histone deacetylase 4 isoform X6 n=1 Tax=Anticarsia gemmatalis TaxID=129554 RepID=UPI003F75F1AF
MADDPGRSSSGSAEMAHESGGGADGSPQHTPSPPHAPRLPLADTSFHHQIMQNQNPRKNHIAERAKQTLESSFLMQLKKQQQLQQEILLQHFQQQRQQLAQEHEQQLMHHLKQKAMEEAARREAREAREALEAREARERHERDRVELLRKKDKHEHSANASTEVKQKLQQFLKKKQASANGTVPGSSYRNWGIIKSSSGESITSTGATATHPYRLAAPLPLALNAAPPQPSPADFPLRKTASEPNMLKVRLKARVIERRASPLARRPLKRVKHRNCEGGSPRGSPPGAGGSSTGVGATAPIREEEEGCSRAAELLFSSPSMPNISLGRPHAGPPRHHPAPAPPPHPPHTPHAPHTPHTPHTHTPVWGCNISVGAPLPLGVGVPLAAVSEAGAGGAWAPRGAKRPLGRTHSAPLPLGDPALQPPNAHHYLRDQIRKTVRLHTILDVLTRAHDAAAAQLREEEGEVIDLTARRPQPSASDPAVPPTLAAGLAAPVPPGTATAALVGTACEPAPLARALSSPLVGARAPPTGLAYDPLMLKHGCACGAHAPTHPEHGGRLQSVWARLCETGLAARAERTRPRKATFEELQSVHSESHVAVFGGRREAGAAGGVRQLVRLACGGLGVDSDTAWSEPHTAPAARMAAGAVLDLAVRTARGDLRNGFAVVRPPGHHAEPNQAMGFCFFNSVAVAARILNTRHRLQRILIVDWDVHHGNGTQQIFYSESQVLYMSIHRHDDGNFFPGTGAATEAGAGAGLGYTVNVAWSSASAPPLADAEYLAAFRSVIMPIAKEYDPEIVLVSCGFDAAAGHPAPLGGYNVSAACFAHMTRELQALAGGRLVLALEGGYDLPAVCDCAQECVRALLGERTAPPAYSELARPPLPQAQDALRTTIAVHQHHWPTLKRFSDSVGLSALEAGTGVAAARLGRLQTERDAADTAAAMATLSMHQAPGAAGAAGPAPEPRSAEGSRSASEEPMEQDEGK